ALGLGNAEIVAIDSLTAQKRLVEAGFGLDLLPSSSVEEELRAGTLHALPIAAMRLEVPVVLVHRRRGHLSGAARALMALLTERRQSRGQSEPTSGPHAFSHVLRRCLGARRRSR